MFGEKEVNEFGTRLSHEHRPEASFAEHSVSAADKRGYETALCCVVSGCDSVFYSNDLAFPKTRYVCAKHPRRLLTRIVDPGRLNIAETKVVPAEITRCATSNGEIHSFVGRHLAQPLLPDPRRTPLTDATNLNLDFSSVADGLPKLAANFIFTQTPNGNGNVLAHME